LFARGEEQLLNPYRNSIANFLSREAHPYTDESTESTEDLGTLELLQRFYEQAEGDEDDRNWLAMSADPTGGLRFFYGVPEALLHQERNNDRAVENLAQDVARAIYQDVTTALKQSTLIAVLYWLAPDIPVRWLSKGSGLEVTEIREKARAHPLNTTFRCLDCDKPIEASSRLHFRQMLLALQNYRENGLQEYLYTGLHCDYCVEERKFRWGEEWKRQQARYGSRLLELRRMPYDEYLQTPEWQAMRERKLESVGRSCEMCSVKGVELHTHHNNYVRRGAELDQDLKILCAGCHKTFHKHRNVNR
jgi:hypothetical protein